MYSFDYVEHHNCSVARLFHCGDSDSEGNISRGYIICIGCGLRRCHADDTIAYQKAKVILHRMRERKHAQLVNSHVCLQRGLLSIFSKGQFTKFLLRYLTWHCDGAVIGRENFHAISSQLPRLQRNTTFIGEKSVELCLQSFFISLFNKTISRSANKMNLTWFENYNLARFFAESSVLENRCEPSRASVAAKIARCKMKSKRGKHVHPPVRERK